jgi:hypothetical protein
MMNETNSSNGKRGANDDYNMLTLKDDILSRGCGSHIFQYLSLKECLQFTCVSRSCFKATLPTLCRRRQEQFLCHYESFESYGGYGAKGGNVRLAPATGKASGKIPNNSIKDSRVTAGESQENNEENIYCHPKVQEDMWRLIPTVKERLEGVYRAVPTSHPLKNRLRALVVDLQGDDGTISENDETFTSLLFDLRKITHAHKLHATLLAACTINLEPEPFTRSIYLTATNNVGNGAGDGQSLTVSLDQYIGDVLLSSCLMSHSADLSGIVEGGTSLNTWLESLLQENSGRNARSSYKSYVYMHGCFLRIMPKTMEGASAVGLAPPVAGIVMQRSFGGGNPLLLQFKCFVEDSLTFRNSRGLAVGRFCLECIFSEFGPLGPAFRGRDRITTTRIADGDFGYMVAGHGYFDVVVGLSEAFSNPGSDPRDFVLDESRLGQSLLRLYSQTRVNRPVTVSAYILIFWNVLYMFFRIGSKTNYLFFRCQLYFRFYHLSSPYDQSKFSMIFDCTMNQHA